MLGSLSKRLQRAEAEDFVENFARQALAFGKAERNGFAVDGVADQDKNFFAGCVAGGAPEFFQVEAVQDLAMQVGLYLLVIASLEGLQICHRGLDRLKQRPGARFTSRSSLVRLLRQPGEAARHFRVAGCISGMPRSMALDTAKY